MTQSAPPSACDKAARISAVSPSMAASHWFAHPQPEIGRHLVIPGPARVQAACGFADDLLQAGLHVHVDVLQVGAEGELAGLDF